MRLLSLLTLVGMVSADAASAALAANREVAPNQSSGYQIARRVAIKEKQRETESPALWMSNRVVKKARSMAFYSEEPVQDRQPAEN